MSSDDASGSNNRPDPPRDPSCEGAVDPVDVADLNPDLAWTFTDPDSGDRQYAYQILVADSSDGLASNSGNVWDSGKVIHSESTAVYKGIDLSRSTTYYWKVRTWDESDAVGEYSPESTFGMSAVLTKEFYVAPQGNDGWSGSLPVPTGGLDDGPIRTLQRAVEIVRAAKTADPYRNFRVLIRQGVYELAAPVVLSDADGAIDSSYYIAYEAYPGESPVISGGQVLDGLWTKGENNIWTTTVSGIAEGQWYFRQLFVNETRKQRSIEPDSGFFTINYVSADVKSIGTASDFPNSWSSIKDAEVLHMDRWMFNRQPVLSFDTQNNRLTSAANTIGRGAGPASAGQPFFVEHALQFVDETGEWFLDKTTGVLHYKAADGEDPNNEQIIASRQLSLIKVLGTYDSEGDYIWNVHFRGLTFAYTDWPMPAHGRNGYQAGFWSWNGTAGTTGPADAVIHFEGTRGGRVENCTFKHYGGSGVILGTPRKDHAGSQSDRTHDNVIYGNEFFDGGDGPIYVGSGNTVTDEAAPNGNQIISNTIRDVGIVNWSAVGIWVGYAQYTQVKHNTITDMPYSAISVGWLSTSGNSSCHHNQTERNKCLRIMGKMFDGGGIYTLGIQPGSTVKWNYIDQQAACYAELYHDEWSDYIETAHNYLNNGPGACGGVSDGYIFLHNAGPNMNVHDNFLGQSPPDPENYGAYDGPGDARR